MVRTPLRVKYWEIIADNISKAGWSLGYVSAADCEGRTIWIADAHRGGGQRFVVRRSGLVNHPSVSRSNNGVTFPVRRATAIAAILRVRKQVM